MQHRLRWIVVGLLLALTVLTRVPAPFAMEVTNDEMLHLQSWRNRYDTDNIHPEFIERFEKSAKFNQSSARVTLVKKLYWSSPLFQRLALTIHDAHPPAFPVLAELTQKLTGSSLVALRGLSVVASLASVCVAYLLGRELGGPTLGWWTAGFLASASIHQMFAGLGRPYALGTLAALGAVHAFVLDRKRDYRTPWRFYLSALAAQSVLWLLWPTLLPLVLVTAWYAWRRLGMAGLVKATWWYALASLLLFAYLQVQTQHPQYVGEVLNNSIFRAGVWLFFTRIAHATPFGHLAARGTAGIVVSGLVFFALAAAGAVHLARLDAKAAPWLEILSFEKYREFFWYLIVVACFCACILDVF